MDRAMEKACDELEKMKKAVEEDNRTMMVLAHQPAPAPAAAPTGCTLTTLAKYLPCKERKMLLA